MAIFSDELRKAIADHLSGEEHSDLVFEALNEGDDGFVHTFLRGCSVPLNWKKIRKLFEGLDDEQLALSAEELLKISIREEVLKDLIDRCKAEERAHQSGSAKLVRQ